MIKNTILQGDCLKILKTLPDKSIDLIFTDSSYWMRVDGILNDLKEKISAVVMTSWITIF